MHYPSFGEYTDALQLDLGTVLSDPVLRRGTLCTHGPGLPIVHGGTFALTFAVVTDAGKYALRCFHKELDALHLRYGAIERHLGRIKSPHFVNCQFQSQGITTESGVYPVVRMDWAEGTSLAAYVADHRNAADALLQLRFALRRLAKHLRAKSIAHGDIQPSNVIVQAGPQLRLIDYDGLFVPGLAPLCSAELGQRNFQHPGRRSRHFNENLDAFSFAAIDLALHALSIRPELWDLTDSGEDAFVFRAVDFADPANSAIFARLAGEPGLERRTRSLASICVSPFESIPTFEDFVAGRAIPDAPVEFMADSITRSRPAYLPCTSVVHAADFAQCCKHVGDRVELVGRVRRVAQRADETERTACLRVEFGDQLCDMACVTIWHEPLSNVETLPDDTWVGEWVSATGLIEPVASDSGGGRHQKDVTISITEQSQLRRLSEGEARYRLNLPADLSLPAPDRADVVRTDPVAPVTAVRQAEAPARKSRRHPPAVPAARTAPRGPAVTPADLPVAAIPGPVPWAQDAGIPPKRTARARRQRWLRWGIGAVVASLAAYFLLAMESGRESAEVGREQAGSAGAAVDATRAAAVVQAVARAEVQETVAVLVSQRTLKATDTTLATGAGTLIILPAGNDGCRRISLLGGEVIPGLCEEVVVFAHSAAYSDREVVVGFTHCDDAAAPCSLRRPFWLELGVGSPATLRQVPNLWAGSSAPVFTASGTGVKVDLGVWDGQRRSATLTPAGNIVIQRTAESARPLSRPDCAVVAQSLEACSTSRDCSSFARSAQRIPASQWARLARAYHESTGLDVAAFRKLCVRSCQLGLTPSLGLIRRNACAGAPPDQWRLNHPAVGLER